ncbi:MAG: hypothetical protein JST70_13995 [Bacteroidetes bacterium]|nr:hypothetical protein [Bacteroidota bacterium]
MTIKELYYNLKDLGLSEDRYYLHGLYGSLNDEDKLALVVIKGTHSFGYEIYFKERGEKRVLKTFTDESEACKYFYQRLKDNKEIEDAYNQKN